jgi:hypothetical protein
MMGRARRGLGLVVGRSAAGVEGGKAVTGSSDVEGRDPGLDGAHTESVHSMNIPSFMKLITKQDTRQPTLRLAAAPRVGNGPTFVDVSTGFEAWRR